MPLLLALVETVKRRLETLKGVPLGRRQQRRTPAEQLSCRRHGQYEADPVRDDARVSRIKAAEGRESTTAFRLMVIVKCMSFMPSTSSKPPGSGLELAPADCRRAGCYGKWQRGGNTQELANTGLRVETTL